MDFSLSDEQQLIIKTTREFVQNELYPHEKEVEESGVLREDLHRELKAKAIDAGLYGANMPVEVGGAGLDTVAWVLYEKELGPDQLRPALLLRGQAVEHPAGVRRRAEGTLSSAHRPRGQDRMSRHDGTRRRFGPARHEDIGCGIGR
jgi:acyl-CoA dehydrogenase